MRQCSPFSCFHGQFEFTKGKVVSPLATQPAKKNDFWLQRERVMLYNRGAVSDVDCPALAAYWWWSIAAHTFYTHTAQSPRMTLAYMGCIFFGSPLCWLIHFLKQNRICSMSRGTDGVRLLFWAWFKWRRSHALICESPRGIGERSVWDRWQEMDGSGLEDTVLGEWQAP